MFTFRGAYVASTGRSRNAEVSWDDGSLEGTPIVVDRLVAESGTGVEYMATPTGPSVPLDVADGRTVAVALSALLDEIETDGDVPAWPIESEGRTLY